MGSVGSSLGSVAESSGLFIPVGISVWIGSCVAIISAGGVSCSGVRSGLFVGGGAKGFRISVGVAIGAVASCCVS